MTGYVIDDLALSAGLADGNEHHRRELSRLLHDAVSGGPALKAPALCLTAASATRPAVAEHLADIVAAAPAGAIDVAGLTRTGHLDALRKRHPRLDWSAMHAAAVALDTGAAVLTVDRVRYAGVGIDVPTL